MTLQYNTPQHNHIHDKTRQDKQDKTRQDKQTHYKPIRDDVIQYEARLGNAKQYNTIQSKTR